MHRPWVAIAAAGSILAILLAGSPPASGGTGTAPAWTVGQSWSYAGYYIEPGVREDFTVTVTVVAITSTSAVLEANHTFDFGWMLQRALFQFPSLRVVCSNQTFSWRGAATLCYTPPLEWLSFPLVAGKTWTVSTSLNGGPSLAGYDYSVLPEATVETPAGPARAFPVTQDAMGIPVITVKNVLPGQGTARYDYSGEVGNIVRYEAFDPQGTTVAFATLTSPALPRSGLPTVVLIAIVAVGVASGVGLAAFMWRRRRRPRLPPAGPS